MKRCPQCNRIENDDALVFCRTDGTILVSDSGSISGEATPKFGSIPESSEIETSILPHRTDADVSRPTAPTTVLPPQSAPNTTLELSTSKPCFYREDQPNAPFKVAIIPFAGRDPVKVLDIPHSINGPAGLRWTPDARALTFVDTTGGVSNIWSLPLDGGKPVQLTDFKTDQIFWFDFSRDGKQLAVSRGTQTSDVIMIKDFR